MQYTGIRRIAHGYGFRGLGDDNLSPSGDTYVNDIGTNAYGDTIVESPTSTGYTPDIAAIWNFLQTPPAANNNANPFANVNPIYIILGVVALAVVFKK
jgi:hypothetical protein